MNGNGLTPLWTESDIDRFFDYFIDDAEDKIFQLLSAAGEQFIKVARESGSYRDHTGNLRSSVGYMIFKDRKAISENFEKSANGSDGSTGVNKARELAESVALSTSGWFLILTAGMEYAATVEAKGYDVISSGCIQAEDFLKSTSKSLFDKLARRGH